MQEWGVDNNMRHKNSINLPITHFSEAFSYLAGITVIVVAVSAAYASGSASTVIDWTMKNLGFGFVGLLATLVFTTLFSLIRLKSAGEDGERRRFWYAVGMQAANGVTTLALTFTLLGISLGIGGLADQNLTPDTVQSVIRNLTANFSLAFMTTVIGLPLSAALRALLVISQNRSATG